MREIFLVLLGVIADQLWRKFRERKTRLRWSDEFQRLAMAREDDRFGRIEVLYNGDPVRDLHVGQVQIENESNRDLEDVAVNLATSEGGQFLATAGQVQGSLEELPFTDTFVTLAEEFHRTDDDERREQLREHLTTRRDYRIPVLNRGEVAQFGLLVHRQWANPPDIQVACDHLGVELRKQPEKERWWGVPRTTAAWIGLLLTLAALYPLVNLSLPTWALTVSAWFLGGVLLLPIGALAIKGWRAVVRMFR